MRLGIGLNITRQNEVFRPATLFAAGEDGAWYDPQSAANTLFQDSTLTTAAASGDPLGGVTDLSGNGNHLVQATALNRGVVATVNGKKMIRTTGSPTHLICNSLASVFSGTGTAWSVHMVVSQQSAGSGTVFSAGNSASTATFLWLVATLSATFRAQWGYDTATDANTSIPTHRIGAFEQVYSVVCNGSTVDIWANGVKVASGLTAPIGAMTVDRFTLGALVRTTVANYGACRWGEVIVRAGVIADASVRQIHDYMIRKWLPISPSIPGTVDLFVVAGQSNAEGRGTGGPTVAAGLGYEIDGGAVRSIADPVGGATSGSAWPSLAQKWYDLTGRRALVTEHAYGGSGLITGVGSPNWTTGTPRTVAAAVTTDVQTWITARGLTLGKCYVVWAQGEQEAIAINGTTITGAIYETSLGVLFDYLDANIPQVDGFLISSLGKLVDGTFDAGHTEIRGAQVNVATARADTHIAFDRAQYFVAESKMIDNVHYNQAGLNEMGEGIATFAAGLL